MKGNFKKTVVFFDFDNTITDFDVFDNLVLRFSKNNHWQDLERLWKKGEIGSRECMLGQLRGLDLTKEELDRYLAKIKVDPYFKRLLMLFKENEIKTIILSDNFDYMLKRILRLNGIGKVRLFSNKLRFKKNKFMTSFPYADKECRTCAHCKKKNILANSDKDSIIIYLGDGRSDICPARYSDMVFAKKDLLEYCSNNNLDYIPYKKLKEAYIYFKRMLA